MLSFIYVLKWLNEISNRWSTMEYQTTWCAKQWGCTRNSSACQSMIMKAYCRMIFTRALDFTQAAIVMLMRKFICGKTVWNTRHAHIHKMRLFKVGLISQRDTGDPIKCTFDINLSMHKSILMYIVLLYWIVFRDLIAKYSVEVSRLNHRILDLICEGLGLEEGFFRGELSETMGMVINNYPPCPEPSLTLGLRAHCDPYTLTLIQQQVYGLQIKKSGQWIGVEPIPNAFLIVIPYQLQVRVTLIFCT